MKNSVDPKHGAQKVTNTDEQEVVVNQSSVQEGGYDEPVNQQEASQPPAEKAPEPEKNRPAKKAPETKANGEEDRKRKRFHDEESE